MKKLIAVLVVLSVFMILPSRAFGQTASPSPTRSPKGQQIRQEVKQRIAEQKEERKAALTEIRQKRIREFFERMMKRFEAAIARLAKLIERIEARMDKINYTDRSQLNDAKAKLQKAKDKQEALKADFETLLTSDDPKAVFKKVGESVRSLKKDLIEIHRILVHIIGDIKGLRVGND